MTHVISPAARAGVEAWLETRPDTETMVRNLIADLAATLVDFEFSRLSEASRIGTELIAVASDDQVELCVADIWLYIVAEAESLAIALETHTDEPAFAKTKPEGGRYPICHYRKRNE